MKKKLLAILLCIVLLVGVLPMSVFAENDSFDIVLHLSTDFDIADAEASINGTDYAGVYNAADKTIRFSGVPLNGSFYQINIQLTDTDGVNYKGTEYVSSSMYNAGDTANIEAQNFNKFVKGNVNVHFGIDDPFPAKNGQKYQLVFKEISISLTDAEGKTYTPELDETGWYTASVPANKSYTLTVEGWGYGRIDGGVSDTTVKHVVPKLQWNLGAQYFDKDRYISLNIEGYAREEAGEPTTAKDVTVTESGKPVANAEVTMKTPDRVILTATTDENGVAKFDVPKSLSGSNYYVVTAKAPDGREKTKSFNSLEEDMVIDLPAPENSFKVTKIVMENGNEVARSSEWMKINSRDSYTLWAPKYFNSVSTCTDVTTTVGTVVNATKDVDNSGRAELNAKLEPMQEVTLTYTYEYTDNDTAYSVSVTHNFTDAKGNVIFTEQGDPVTAKPGEKVTVSPYKGDGSDFFKRSDLKGYEDGAWHFVLSYLSGQDIANTPREDGTTDVSFVMPHNSTGEGAARVAFNYAYTDTYVEYNANHPDARGAMATDWLAEEGSATVADNEYTRPNYVFTGWNTEPDGSGTSYVPGDIIKVTGPVKLYAMWDIDPEYVIDITVPVEKIVTQLGSVAPDDKTFTFALFDLEGNELDTVTIENAEVATTGAGTYKTELKFSIKAADFAKLSDGFVICEVPEEADGWTFSESVYAAVVTLNDKAQQDSVVIKNEDGEEVEAASFENSFEAYTLTYESNGGTAFDPETYTAGTVVDLSKTPAKRGFNFDGWYTDKGLTQKADKVTMTADTTVYAKWTEVSKPDDTPKTGDDNLILMWALVAMASLSGAGAISIATLESKRKSKR